ncbi:MAG: hypothetical protein J6X37_01975 [Treponema sp.]|nr:hypothetical protein [Treponema sp.]
MNGLMKNFNESELSDKDKLAQEFIKNVNPYRSKPSLGIDLRRLSRYAKENDKSIATLTNAEIQEFKIN